MKRVSNNTQQGLTFHRETTRLEILDFVDEVVLMRDDGKGLGGLTERIGAVEAN